MQANLNAKYALLIVDDFKILIVNNFLGLSVSCIYVQKYINI